MQSPVAPSKLHTQIDHLHFLKVPLKFNSVPSSILLTLIEYCHFTNIKCVQLKVYLKELWIALFLNFMYSLSLIDMKYQYPN